MESKKGAVVSNRYTQLTVFEAEALHEALVTYKAAGGPQRHARNRETSLSASPTASPCLPMSLATSSVIGHEQLRTVEGRQWAVHHWQQVQVQLVAAEAGAELRMPPLLLCRADSDKHTLASSPNSISLSTSETVVAAIATQPPSVSSTPPFPFAAVESKLVATAVAAGGAGAIGEPGGETAGVTTTPGAAGGLKEAGGPVAE
ncbi:unnamed protein product [Closterium sp. NIES-54]